MTRPRALWVTALPPAFDGGGGHIRQAHLLQALGERFEVHLVVAGGPVADDVAAATASVTQIASQPAEPDVSTSGKVRDVARTVFGHHHEVSLLAGVRREMAPVLDRLQPVDLVQVEFTSLWPLVRHRLGSHWAITLHNLGSGMSEHRSAIADRWHTRRVHQRRAATSRRVEREVVAAYDTTIVASDEDAASVGGGAVVVPNGVDLDRFTPSAPPEAARLVFTGALYTDPNIDGVRWLVEEVWPLIKRRRADAELSVVGMAPTAEVRQACRAPGVTLHADVESTAAHLAAARVAVVPIRVGTGSRLKALEAMAAGRPVVGTTIGLGGLSYTPGRDALVADEPAGFADAVLRLLEPGSEPSALAARGRALVEAEYSWRTLGTRYVRLLEERLSTAGRG